MFFFVSLLRGRHYITGQRERRRTLQELGKELESKLDTVFLECDENLEMKKVKDQSELESQSFS